MTTNESVEPARSFSLVEGRQSSPEEPLSNSSSPTLDPPSRQLIGMRWWLGLAFAAVAGLTAVAVVAVLSNRSERAFRTYAEEFAVGNTVAASENLKRIDSPDEIANEAVAISERRHLALFVFDSEGRPLTPLRSQGVVWASVPGGREALQTALNGRRYIVGRRDGSAFVIGLGIHGGHDRVVVAYLLRPELREQLGIVRQEFLQSALLAFAAGAALGLLIASLTARRLKRIASAAKAVGAGDFSVHSYDRFPDEVGSLAGSIERMRGQLEELFHTLEQDRDRLERLVDRLNEGVLLVDRDLVIEFANGHARELLGVEDRLDVSTLTGDAAEDLRALADELFTTGLPSHTRIADGERTLLVAGIPPTAGGENAIIVIEDESEHARNERVQREFATNAAHELRTPLTSIVTAVEMLQTGAKDEPETRDEFLEVIARESGRLTRLTRALLVLARAGARDELPSLGVVPVAPLLEQVAASLPHRKGVEIGVDCPSALMIVGDADLLEQALSSVATNAMQHTDAGTVTMRGRQLNGSVVIEVADTGPGIPAPDRARIFDRFYRAGDRDGRLRARPLDRARGGPNTRRRDRARLRADCRYDRPHHPRHCDRRHRNRRSHTMSPRILVVDDEPSLVRGLTYALERERFEVEVATDGEAAVEAALTHAIDLVVLDLMLPKLSGEEACQQIRSQSDVPIIMLTAKDSERDLLTGLDLGADDYVTKPFSAAELIGRIHALLRRRALDMTANEQLVRTVGAIKVDLVRDEVSVDGKVVSLTPSEFKILGLLAADPGAAYSRRQIMEHLWGSTFTADEHTCEVHVSALRRKIERDPAAPERLVTVRGVGYALVA